MPKVCRIVLILLIPAFCLASLEVVAEPDSTHYSLGDSIIITVSVTNHSNETAHLNFPSSCWLSYILGPIFWELEVGCSDALTVLNIGPFETFSQTLEYPVTYYELQAGTYPIFGGLWPTLEGFSRVDRHIGEPVYVTIGTDEPAFPYIGFIPVVNTPLLASQLHPARMRARSSHDRSIGTQKVFIDFLAGTSWHPLGYSWGWGHAFFFVADTNANYDLSLFFEDDTGWAPIPYNEDFFAAGSGERAFHLIVADGESIIDTSSIIFNLAAGTNTLSTEYLPPADFGLHCYPNPFNPLIHIQFSSLAKEQFQARIHDLSGRLVWQKELSGLQGYTNIVWEPDENVESGVYLLSVYSESGLEQQKILYLR